MAAKLHPTYCLVLCTGCPDRLGCARSWRLLLLLRLFSKVVNRITNTTQLQTTKVLPRPHKTSRYKIIIHRIVSLFLTGKERNWPTSYKRKGGIFGKNFFFRLFISYSTWQASNLNNSQKAPAKRESLFLSFLLLFRSIPLVVYWSIRDKRAALDHLLHTLSASDFFLFFSSSTLLLNDSPRTRCQKLNEP